MPAQWGMMPCSQWAAGEKRRGVPVRLAQMIKGVCAAHGSGKLILVKVLVV